MPSLGLRRRSGLDLGLGPVQPDGAVGGQGLAPAPEVHRVLERRLTGFELGDDGDELLAGVLVAQPGDVGEGRPTAGGVDRAGRGRSLRLGLGLGLGLGHGRHRNRRGQ